MQSSMSTTESQVFTSTGSLPFTMRRSNLAEPPVRPGPCTDEGFTHTTGQAEFLAERQHPTFAEELRSLVVRQERSRDAGCPRGRPRRLPRRSSWRTRCARPCATLAAAAARATAAAPVDVGAEHRTRVAQAHRVHAGDVEDASRTRACRRAAPRDRRGRPERPRRRTVRARSAPASDRASARTSRPSATSRRSSAPPTKPVPPVRKTGPPTGQRPRAAWSRPDSTERNRAKVLHGRDDRDHGRDRHQPLVEVPVADADVGPPDRERDRDELHRCLPLAPHRGRHDDAVGGRDRAREPHDQQLSPHDHERDPRGDAADRDEREQHTRHQQLVGGGVEEAAEGGGLLPPAREAPVEEVGGRREREQQRGGRVRPTRPGRARAPCAITTGVSAMRR